MAAFYYGLLFLGRKCLLTTSEKRALSQSISLAVNYRLFSHGDVSYRSNGKHDNVVLESVDNVMSLMLSYLTAVLHVGLNSIYSVIINTIVNIYTMSCETGSDAKHIAYI